MKKIILTVLFLLSAAAAFADGPAPWKGYVTIDSSNASAGALVQAYVDDAFNSNTTTGELQTKENNYYAIPVVGAAGKRVIFKIYGINASPEQSWSEGIHELNLSINTTANGQACPLYSGYSLPSTYNLNPGCTGGYCVHGYCRSSTTYCGDSSCDSGESCSSCSSDCGACSGGGSSSGNGGGGGSSSTCSENWQCTEWSECSASGTQTRTCSDTKICNTTKSKPNETQSCAPSVQESPQIEIPSEADMQYTETPCRTDSDCNDNNPSTVDRCDELGKVCYYTPEQAAQAQQTPTGHVVAIPDQLEKKNITAIIINTALLVMAVILGVLIYAYKRKV
jgi:hypothetical protein